MGHDRPSRRAVPPKPPSPRTSLRQPPHEAFATEWFLFRLCAHRIEIAKPLALAVPRFVDGPSVLLANGFVSATLLVLCAHRYAEFAPPGVNVQRSGRDRCIVRHGGRTAFVKPRPTTGPMASA